MEGAHETKEDGWVSSENYVCSEVRVFEHLPSDEAMSRHGSNRGASTRVSKAQVMRG